MYKYLVIDDFVKYYIHNTENNILIITNNKLENICNIYIYDIKKINKLYYLYYSINTYDEENILIHYHINNIERGLNNEISYELIDTFTTLEKLLDYLNNQLKKIHISHYLIHNSNIYRNSTMYYIHHISKLLK